MLNYLYETFQKKKKKKKFFFFWFCITLFKLVDFYKIKKLNNYFLLASKIYFKIFINFKILFINKNLKNYKNIYI